MSIYNDDEEEDNDIFATIDYISETLNTKRT